MRSRSAALASTRTCKSKATGVTLVLHAHWDVSCPCKNVRVIVGMHA